MQAPSLELRSMHGLDMLDAMGLDGRRATI
jgi:hypothetical protein